VTLFVKIHFLFIFWKDGTSCFAGCSVWQKRNIVTWHWCDQVRRCQNIYIFIHNAVRRKMFLNMTSDIRSMVCIGCFKQGRLFAKNEQRAEKSIPCLGSWKPEAPRMLHIQT
jgi:hypothetical protein